MPKQEKGEEEKKQVYVFNFFDQLRNKYMKEEKRKEKQSEGKKLNKNNGLHLNHLAN